MQFRRVKIIFIIYFIIIDIFLLAFYQMNKTSESKEINQTTKLITTIKNEGIHLDKVSYDRNSMWYVSEVDDKGKDDIYVEKTNYKVNSIADVKKWVNKKFSNRYIFSKIKNQHDLNEKIKAGDDIKIYFLPVGNTGFGIYDENNFLIVEVNNKKIVNCQYDNKDINYENINDSKDTISEAEAIVSLYQHNYLIKNDKILASQLIYQPYTQANDYQIYIPIWSFLISHDKDEIIAKVNAITGKIFN